MSEKCAEKKSEKLEMEDPIFYTFSRMFGFRFFSENDDEKDE